MIGSYSSVIVVHIRTYMYLSLVLKAGSCIHIKKSYIYIHADIHSVHQIISDIYLLVCIVKRVFTRTCTGAPDLS